MFKDICMGNYDLDWELHRSYFLSDSLYEEISYELKESRVIIYKKLDNGISEEITLDELIFYIHTDVAVKIISEIKNKNVRGGIGGEGLYDGNYAEIIFRKLFKSIDAIKKAVENMKIILKYDVDSDSEDGEDGEDGEEESKDDGVSGEDGTNEDNETLAF